MKKIPRYLRWTYVYLFWIVNCISLCYISINNNSWAFDAVSGPQLPRFLTWVVVYWWILGIVTLLIDLYHFYFRHWKNGILISLLVVFWILFYIDYLT